MRLFAACFALTLCIFTDCYSFAAVHESITVNDLSIAVIDHSVKVDCEVQYSVHGSVEEALSNGIAMTFILEVELRQEDTLWLDSTLGKFKREFKVKYHGLSKQYVMVEMGGNIERSFPDLYSAFYYQKRLRNVAIATIDSLNLDQKYYIRARARLVSEQLPLPLRIKSYVSKDWRPSSGWTIWPM